MQSKLENADTIVLVREGKRSAWKLTYEGRVYWGQNAAAVILKAIRHEATTPQQEGIELTAAVKQPPPQTELGPQGDGEKGDA
jgi:hypothetical protein